jgi:cytoskeletal protein RodZ
MLWTAPPAQAPKQHDDKVGLTKQHPDRAPMKALRMQVTEKPRESQMSPLSLMFAALLLLVIVGTSALAWWLVGAWLR